MKVEGALEKRKFERIDKQYHNSPEMLQKVKQQVQVLTAIFFYI